VARASNMAEIGCGNGLLQRQIEDVYGREVTGCDLNEYALARNISRQSPVLCYDIHQRNEDLRKRFDLIFLFDVVEHIDDEVLFFEAVKFHLAPGGRIIVNVPAGQWAYSEYDRVAGHFRRYSICSLREALDHCEMRIATWSYWGLPLIPSLLLRKLWLRGEHDKEKIITAGFDSRTMLINRCLRLLASCEPIPQKVTGTSLMAVLYVSEK
jgi:SAM-dependent methyltransferase